MLCHRHPEAADHLDVIGVEDDLAGSTMKACPAFALDQLGYQQ
jgi:hypothetical protein